jgi:hypothetical protein
VPTSMSGRRRRLTSRVEFIDFTRSVWCLSTCQDVVLMTAFVEDGATGYPLFADDKHVAEFDPKIDDGFAVLSMVRNQG